MNSPNSFTAQDAENYKEKTLCVFALDISGSMTISGQIALLNSSMENFLTEIVQDSTLAHSLELAIVTFNHQVTVHTQPQLVSSLQFQPLVAHGSTCLADGVLEAIELVRKRKEYYKSTGIPYRRPFIIAITDGLPDQDQDMDGLAAAIRAGEVGSHFVFIPLATDEQAVQPLKEIAVRKPFLLREARFENFFDWLRNSIQIVSSRTGGSQVRIPPFDDVFTI